MHTKRQLSAGVQVAWAALSIKGVSEEMENWALHQQW